VHVGDSVERGQIIGRITDYFGNERQRLAAVAGGEVGFLVTSLAINAGDPLLAIIS
jgi:predicted deacylase